MQIIKVKDYEEMSKKASDILSDKLKGKPELVLGLATGSTPEGLYKLLIEQYKNNEISFKQAKTFNLDEYVGLDRQDSNSYYYYMNNQLFKHIDIPLEQTNIPNGIATDSDKECSDYEKLIKEQGGIDIQLLGMGLNGHIGFNEPGTPFTSRTHVVTLDESTRQANARFFDSLDDVPTNAITMGIETIMDSKEIVMLVSGEAKASTLQQVIQGEVTKDVPATILQRHPNVTIIADEAALSKVR
ncbi:glucosamine-6-phosphate deaminase [Virgibacillus soli]|uniref:glucosamine-6-phosphate deaminase n=1 Tax=Paracerasibacillus soli TaxID=480284 RepID=UPI0035EF92CB